MKPPFNSTLPLRFSNSESSWEDDVGDDDVMVVGIDFGTTYSGAAWATKDDFESDQINLITNWPEHGREEGKAPTELFYEDDEILWGYAVPKDVDPVRWFKLLLLKDEDLDDELRSSEFLLRARKMLRENDKTAVDLIADYLRLLWKHILETIVKSRGDSVVEALTFHIVITVPAIWKGYARQGMEKAAEMSGMLDDRPAGPTTLSYAPEPEAAALSTLCEPGRKPNTGEVYVICDAGGGTVDLISYKIDSINPISMQEAAEGTGGLCGGIFIDEAFEIMCKNRLGRKWDNLSKVGIKDIMKGEWEQSIKPQFKPMDTKKEHIVAIPAEAFGKKSLTDLTKEPFIKNGRIHFTGAHIQKVFTKAFSDIDQLVDAQVAKAQDQGLTVAGIILVGGLGASPYLYEHLKARHAYAGIQVMQSGGMKPRTAICRGAVFKGFLGGMAAGTGPKGNYQDVAAPIRVTSTVSRASYGIKFRTPYNAALHLEEDKEWDFNENEMKAGNQMQWYIKRGENVSTKDPVSHSYYRTFRKDYSGTLDIDLYQCNDLEPPLRGTASVTSLCTISCILDVPVSTLRDFQGSGGEIKKLDFDVRMVPSGASAEFAIYVDGRRLGGHNTNISFE
ncbi:Fc.00g001130.m01.CDS01 [Cosmosporella sp. VM-42]